MFVCLSVCLFVCLPPPPGTKGPKTGPKAPKLDQRPKTGQKAQCGGLRHSHRPRLCDGRPRNWDTDPKLGLWPPHRPRFCWRKASMNEVIYIKKLGFM